MMAWIKMNFPSYDMRFEMNNMIMCYIKLEISHKDKGSGQYVINDFLKAWSHELRSDIIIKSYLAWN